MRLQKNRQETGYNTIDRNFKTVNLTLKTFKNQKVSYVN